MFTQGVNPFSQSSCGEVIIPGHVWCVSWWRHCRVGDSTMNKASHYGGHRIQPGLEGWRGFGDPGKVLLYLFLLILCLHDISWVSVGCLFSLFGSLMLLFLRILCLDSWPSCSLALGSINSIVFDYHFCVQMIPKPIFPIQTNVGFKFQLATGFSLMLTNDTMTLHCPP